MSSQQPEAKKRKTGHNPSYSYATPAAPTTTSAKPTTYSPNGTYKPSTRFIPSIPPRQWTVSIAIPATALSVMKSTEQRNRMPGLIARAASVFSIDEIVVFDDRPQNDKKNLRNKQKGGYVGGDAEAQDDGTNGGAGGPADWWAGDGEYTGDTDPAHFLAHCLNFLETPPFMRRSLFAPHPNLELAGVLPSLDLPSHPHTQEWLGYREGVVMDPESVAENGGPGGNTFGTGSNQAKTGPKGDDEKATVVDIGGRSVSLPDIQIAPWTRVTLHFPQGPDGPPEAVAFEAPRTEGGFYWGYKVRKCDTLSAVFTECPFETGYDVSIGTSERGKLASQAFPSRRGKVPGKKGKKRGATEETPKDLDFNHLIIVFGGPKGLEYSAVNDEELAERGITGSCTQDLFDHWVNFLPGQGSRTIRTEEAVFIGLTALRRLWDDS